MTARERARALANDLETIGGNVLGDAMVDAIAAAIEAAEGEARVAAEQELVSLRERVKNQAWQLGFNDRHNHERNIELDALHFVWCDGGCKGGVHRYNHGELTEDIVIAAERNAKRLRTWFVNKAGRDAQGASTTPEGAAMASDEEREAEARRAAHEVLGAYCLAAALNVGEGLYEHAALCDRFTASLLTAYRERDAARAALARVEGERDRLRELAKGLEWAGGDPYGMPCCPDCGESAPNEDREPWHQPECELATLIAAPTPAAPAEPPGTTPVTKPPTYKRGREGGVTEADIAWLDAMAAKDGLPPMSSIVGEPPTTGVAPAKCAYNDCDAEAKWIVFANDGMAADLCDRHHAEVTGKPTGEAPAVCGTCEGKGRKPGQRAGSCRDCGGTGGRTPAKGRQP